MNARSLKLAPHTARLLILAPVVLNAHAERRSGGSTRRTRRLKIAAQRRLGLKIADDALRTPFSLSLSLCSDFTFFPCPTHPTHPPPNSKGRGRKQGGVEGETTTTTTTTTLTGAHLPLVPTTPLTTCKGRSFSSFSLSF